MGDLTLQGVAAAHRSTSALEQRLVHRRFLGEHDDHEHARVAAAALVARLGDRLRLLRVVVDGVERGHVWLAVEGADELGVLDLTLDDRSLAQEVRAGLVASAREEGFGRLSIGVAPADPVLEAFTIGGDFAVSAFQMRLPLDDRLPVEDAVRLVPMSPEVYEPFMARSCQEYAEARAKAGEPPERAREVAAEQMAELLPDGLGTTDHHFFLGEVDGARVGTLWLGTERPMTFVYDVEVDEARRRQGHGAGLMRAAAVWARERGSHALGLNVFAYNHSAKTLYDRLGYEVVEQHATHRL